MPDEPARTAPCPHCGAATGRAPGRAPGLCASCGALLGGAWPPTPAGRPPLPPLPPPTLTGRAWADFALGAAGLYLSHLATARILLRFMPAEAKPSRGRASLAPALLPGMFDLCEIFWAVLLGLLLYFGVRPFFAAVARGSGYATLVLLAVLLGAFFTCRPLLY